MEFTESHYTSGVNNARIYERNAEPEGDAVGVVLIIHGLGDHSERHDEVAEILVGKGYAAKAFDWPGNGRSEGKPGHLPEVEVAGEMICEALERSGKKIESIYAHSTGAFFLLNAIYANPEAFADIRWIWLSSPLISPRNGQSALKIRVANFLADYFPRLTLSTGVSQADCFHSGRERLIPVPDDPKLHNLVSLRAATDLLNHEEGLESRVEQLSDSIAWIFTQGDEDTVCPLPFAMNVFLKLASKKKTFVTLSGARHEPMNEPDHSGLTAAVRSWLELMAQDKAATSH